MAVHRLPLLDSSVSVARNRGAAAAVGGGAGVCGTILLPNSNSFHQRRLRRWLPTGGAAAVR